MESPPKNPPSTPNLCSPGPAPLSPVHTRVAHKPNHFMHHIARRTPHLTQLSHRTKNQERPPCLTGIPPYAGLPGAPRYDPTPLLSPRLPAFASPPSPARECFAPDPRDRNDEQPLPPLKVLPPRSGDSLSKRALSGVARQRTLPPTAARS